jgi:hypothetical protein
MSVRMSTMQHTVMIVSVGTGASLHSRNPINADESYRTAGLGAQ